MEVTIHAYYAWDLVAFLRKTFIFVFAFSLLLTCNYIVFMIVFAFSLLLTCNRNVYVILFILLLSCDLIEFEFCCLVVILSYLYVSCCLVLILFYLNLYLSCCSPILIMLSMHETWWRY